MIYEWSLFCVHNLSFSSSSSSLFFYIECRKRWAFWPCCLALTWTLVEVNLTVLLDSFLSCVVSGCMLIKLCITCHHSFFTGQTLMRIHFLFLLFYSTGFCAENSEPAKEIHWKVCLFSFDYCNNCAVQTIFAIKYIVFCFWKHHLLCPGRFRLLVLVMFNYPLFSILLFYLCRYQTKAKTENQYYTDKYKK